MAGYSLVVYLDIKASTLQIFMHKAYLNGG